MSKSATKYTAITDSAEETFSTKQAAIRFGEKTGEQFYVRTSGGAVVHDTRDGEEAVVEEVTDDVVTLTDGDAEEDVQGSSKDEDTAVLNYREHGPKHFYKALTAPVLARFKDASRGRDFTVSVPAAEAGRVLGAWDEALAQLKGFKKSNASYQRQSTKTDAGRKLRYELEQEFLAAQVKKALR